MPKREKQSGKESKPLTFFDHLEELRQRIITVILILLTSSILIFLFFNHLSLYKYFLNPLNTINQKLYYHTLTEPFMVRVKISILMALILTSPAIIFHIIRFTFPALKTKEKKTIIILLCLIFLLFSSGVFFSYKVLIPQSIQFLEQFAPDEIPPLLHFKEYINLFFSITFASGLIFLFPILILFLTKIGIIDHKFLIKHLGESIIVILVISALITPPDYFSQILLSLPLFLLYLISLILSYILNIKNRSKHEKR